MIKTQKQIGATLIEVLISILILSFGLLGMGNMMATAIQLPKLSALRITAANIAANHIDRIRANPTAFANGTYDETLSYDGTFTVPAASDCSYPSCDATSLATMDKANTRMSLRQELPAGGLRVQRDGTSGTASTTEGNLWVIWQEPGTISAFSNISAADNCPSQVTSTYTNPAPRCLYMRFKL
ncbi:MAG: type IV pilus modification protein PilV [Rhodoferax sp.]|nr:type IV pilus modification protein PilV [Rhodoferax sp.]